MKLFHQAPTPVVVDKNEDGWPNTQEISHICHWSACINPNHLVWEARWKNWKRLYCFGCDCNMQPACLGKFHPSSYWEEEKNWPKKLGYGEISELKERLPSLVKVLPENHFKK